MFFTEGIQIFNEGITQKECINQTGADNMTELKITDFKPKVIL